jgi:hypothetical protein
MQKVERVVAEESDYRPVTKGSEVEGIAEKCGDPKKMREVRRTKVHRVYGDQV